MSAGSQTNVVNAMHAMFSRSLSAFTEDLRGPLLPTLSDLLKAGHWSPHVLEIGCGSARALIELTSLAESERRRVCSVGTNFLNYTLKFWASRLNELRSGGLGATIETGPLSHATIETLSSRFGLRAPTRAPHIVNVDYYRGLPFASREFDLVLSGSAMKLVNNSHDFPVIGDEVLRVLTTGGSALVQMFSCSGNSIESNRLRWLDSALLRNRTQRVLVAEKHPSQVAGLKAAMHGMVPLELVVGFAAPAAGDHCEDHHGECTRPCTRDHAASAPRDAGDERCVMALVLGTDCKLLLFLHVLRNTSACSGRGIGALEPSTLSRAVESFKGQLRTESAADREAILSALNARDGFFAAVMDKRPDPQHTPIDSTPASARARIEMQVGSIRRWVRGPSWRQPVRYARSWCRAKEADGATAVC